MKHCQSTLSSDTIVKWREGIKLGNFTAIQINYGQMHKKRLLPIWLKFILEHILLTPRWVQHIIWPKKYKNICTFEVARQRGEGGRRILIMTRKILSFALALVFP